ncbi:hypothetical protein FQZ97_1078330 [compost metagenome]
MLGAQARERCAQARAAGEIVDGGVGEFQHLVGVPVAEGRSQVGQLGAEGECRTWCAVRCLVQEGQQQPGVALHGARDVDQDQQRQRLAPPGHAGDLQQLAVVPTRLLQRARPVRAVATRAGAFASRAHRRQGQGDVAHQLFDQA